MTNINIGSYISLLTKFMYFTVHWFCLNQKTSVKCECGHETLYRWKYVWLKYVCDCCCSWLGSTKVDFVSLLTVNLNIILYLTANIFNTFVVHLLIILIITSTTCTVTNKVHLLSPTAWGAQSHSNCSSIGYCDSSFVQKVAAYSHITVSHSGGSIALRDRLQAPKVLQSLPCLATVFFRPCPLSLSPSHNHQISSTCLFPHLTPSPDQLHLWTSLPS